MSSLCHEVRLRDVHMTQQISQAVGTQTMALMTLTEVSTHSLNTPLEDLGLECPPHLDHMKSCSGVHIDG